MSQKQDYLYLKQDYLYLKQDYLWVFLDCTCGL